MPGDGGCFRQHGQYRNRNSGKEFDSSAFHGKKLAAFGNSITAGDNSWAFQLRYLLDFGDFYNGAGGGAIWGKRKRDNGTTQDYDDPDFAGISNSSNDPIQARYNNCGVVHIQKFLADRPDFILTLKDSCSIPTMSPVNL